MVQSSAPRPTVRGTKSAKSSKTRLGADSWVAAALVAIGRQGVASLSVEALAAELGVTKGSFYWHFANRDTLVMAALQHWEEIATRAVIAAAEQGGTARERLALLLDIVIRPAPEDAIEAAILTAVPDPLTSPVTQRVAERRIAYLASIFRGLGFSRAVAARRARTAYAAYIGMLHLETDSHRFRTVRAARAYVDELTEMFVSGAPNPD